MRAGLYQQCRSGQLNLGEVRVLNMSCNCHNWWKHWSCSPQGDGCWATDYKSYSQCYHYITWKSWGYSEKWTWNDNGFCSVNASFYDTSLKVYQADRITEKIDIVWGRSRLILWTQDLCWVHRFLAIYTETIHVVETHLTCAEDLCLLTIFKITTPSIESNMPIKWDSCERLPMPNTQENWIKGSCFIKTILLNSIWLLYMTVAFK